MPTSPKNFNLGFTLKGTMHREKNFRFSENTTYGCGGTAKSAFFPDGVPSARRAYDLASKGNFLVLGCGSNVLASDCFYDGIVISTRKLSGIYRVNESVLCCLAGTKISSILNYCTRNNLGGLEYMYGIPATIGGAAYMNAGVRGRYIESNIVKVRLYNGKQFDLSHKECNFTYKHSTMRDINAMILSVFLKIKPDCKKNDIISNMLFYKDLRKGLPKGRSCGCVFKNIGEISAGKIIQDCNLGGVSIGFARVSEKHCNFIINEGASASDIKKLIDLIKKTVYEKTSVKLEEEVVYIGDFNDSYG